MQIIRENIAKRFKLQTSPSIIRFAIHRPAKLNNKGHPLLQRRGVIFQSSPFV